MKSGLTVVVDFLGHCQKRKTERKETYFFPIEANNPTQFLILRHVCKRVTSHSQSPASGRSKAS